MNGIYFQLSYFNPMAANLSFEIDVYTSVDVLGTIGSKANLISAEAKTYLYMLMCKIASKSN